VRGTTPGVGGESPPGNFSFMLTTNRLTAKFIPAVFGGMCLVLLFWALGTIFLETHLGWPADRSAIGHRAVGWFVNLVLLRTFLKGMRRYYALRWG